MAGMVPDAQAQMAAPPSADLPPPKERMSRTSFGDMESPTRKSKAEKPEAAQRQATRMDVMKLKQKMGEAKTDLERAIHARLHEADGDDDGKIGAQEIVDMVKDLVLTQRHKTRYRLLAGLVSVLLFCSLAANFGLTRWAIKISKETKVKASKLSEMPAGTRRRLKGGELVEEPFWAEEQPMFTGMGSDLIVATKEATKTVPLYVAPVMGDDLGAGVVLKYSASDVTGKVAHRRLEEGKVAESAFDESMEVESVEHFSDTHVKFTGKDGTVVEVVDGKASVKKSHVSLRDIMDSPAFGGKGVGRRRARQLVAMPSAGKVLIGGVEFDYQAEKLEEEEGEMKKPIGGSPMLTLPSKNIDDKHELIDLEEKALDGLKKIGVDVEERRRRLRALKEDDHDHDHGDGPVTVEELMEPPEYFHSETDSPLKSLLAPAVDAIAFGRKKLNGKGTCNPAVNPACAPCTDSILGCKPLTVDHLGKLGDRMGRRRLNSGGRLLSTTKTTSTLFISERIGGEEAGEQEIFFADEGICGVKAKSDSSEEIRTLAFRGCDSTSFSEPLGKEGRKKALNKDDLDPFEAAFMEDDYPGKRLLKGKEKQDVELPTKTGEEGLINEYTDDTNDEPFDGFRAAADDGLEAFKFTRKLKYNSTTYTGEAEYEGADLGKPVTRRRLQAGLPEYDFPKGGKSATLGTRLVGIVVDSDDKIKGISFIFKDDCAHEIEDLAAYDACKEQFRTDYKLRRRRA